MEYKEIIQTRKSCRCFRSDEVEEEKLKTIIQAGILAPTAHNLQPFRFIVVKGEQKNEIVEDILEELRAYKKIGLPISSAIRSARILRDAPVNVYILLEEINYFKYDELKIELDNYCFDYIHKQVMSQNALSAGCAIENMLLAAKDAGLGAICISEICFAQKFATEYFKPYLGDKCYRLVSSLAIGYEYQEMMKKKSIRKPYEDIVVEFGKTACLQ